MKANSHLIGIGIGAALIAGWMWYADKQVEVFMDYRIIKRRGKFVAERIAGEAAHNPEFGTIDEVRAWVQAQPVIPITTAMLPGVGSDDRLLLPPPGRTLTASGQVLGGLGFDVYDAAPYQYNRDAINDLQGWGKSISRAVSKAVAPVAKVVTQVVPTVTKVLKVTAPFNPALFTANMALNTAKIAVRTISNPAAGFKMAVRGLKSFTVTPLMQAGMLVGIVKPPKQTVVDGAPEYQDANGKVISKEEYDKLAAAADQSTPKKATDYKGYSIWTLAKVNPDAGGGVLYLINYDAAANACEGAYDSMAAAQAAIDAVVQEPAAPPVVAPSPVVAPPPVVAPQPPPVKQAGAVFAQAYRGHAISTIATGSGVIYALDTPDGATAPSGQSFPTMSAAQAAIDATVPQQPAYSPPPQQQSYYPEPQQSSPMPVQPMQVETPSARFESAPQSAAPAPAANKGAGLVIGGGLLAATVAVLMNR